MDRKYLVYPALWCIALIAAYALIVELSAPRIAVAPSQWSMNRIKAERYVVSRRAPAAVIVGSSLSFRLPEEALGPDIANLAFGGVGPLTGLEVVYRARTRPGTVVIETNFIFSGVDQNLLDALFAPVFADLRAAAPVFRYEYQPVNVAFHALRTLTGRAAQADPRASPDVLERMLLVHRRQLEQLPPADAAKLTIEKLGDLASALERQGVKVVLLEMPVHAELAGLAAPRAARALMENRFPGSRYRWIEPKNDRPFVTSDGLHLVPADAAAVARQVRAFLTAAR